MPLRVRTNIPQFAIGVGIGPSDHYVRRAFDQLLEYAHNLRPGLAFTENDFGKSLAIRPRVVDTGIADILKRKIFYSQDRVLGRDRAFGMSAQDRFYFIDVHIWSN